MVNAPAHSVGSGNRAKSNLASLMGRIQGFPSGSGWYKKSGCLQYPGVLQETQRTYTHWCQFPSQQSRKWRICLASAVQWVRSISVTFHRNRRPRKEEPPVRVHVYLLSFCFRLCRYRKVSVPARTRAPAPMPR